MKIFNYDYKIGDKFMVRNKSAYKYETPYKGPYGINQPWTNGMVALEIVATENQLITCTLKPYRD